MKLERFACVLILQVWLGVLGTATGAEPARHLFLDPGTIVAAERVSFAVNPPERREIVIRPDRPWEQLMITFYLTVRDEAGRLRMWYVCRDAQNRANVAYAESANGVDWTKPNLRIVQYEGSGDNNLVGLSSLEGVVFQDPGAPPEERYGYVTHMFGEGMVRFCSPDGLRWRRDKAPLLRLGADTQNVTFWDERLHEYVLYLRGWDLGPDKKKYRKVVRTTVANLRTPIPVGPSEASMYLWGKDKAPVIGDEFPTVFKTDEDDPPNSDVYTMSAQPYPLDSHWYVAFPSIFQREQSNSQGRLEVQFAGSRDGIAWHRYDRKPYVALGLSGSESANMVYMGTGLVVRGDEIWQYGTGFRSKHGDFEARKKRTDGAIFRCVQRLDGFVSLDFASGGGQCRTAPVKIDGPRMAVNLDAGALGHLRAGLVDSAGRGIDGFGMNDCEVLRGNATRALVSWKGGDLNALQGQAVGVVFSGARARLYSFSFAEETR